MSTESPNVYDNILKTLGDLYGLPPEVIDLDVVTLMGVWAGPTSFTNPTPYDFQVGYDHILWGIGAFIQNPTDNPQNYTKLEFNLYNSFENKEMFQRPINCGAFFSTLGCPDKVNALPAFKKLPDRTTITVRLSAAAGAAAWSGAAKSVGILLYGAKINAVYMSQRAAQQAGG
jgi:hypothetical protein